MKLKGKQFLLIILWLMVMVAFMQMINAQQPYMIHLEEEDGLPSSTVYSVIQDSIGRLWFATDNGVAVYDSKNMTVYNRTDGLSYNDVLRLHLDSRGQIWACCFNGTISIYRNGVWESQKEHPGLQLDLKGNGNFALDIEEDSSGDFFVATSHGDVFKISGDLKKKAHLLDHKYNVWSSPFVDLIPSSTGEMDICTPLGYGQIRHGWIDYKYQLKDTINVFRYRFFRHYEGDTLIWVENDTISMFDGVHCFTQRRFPINSQVNRIEKQKKELIVAHSKGLTWLDEGLREKKTYLPNAFVSDWLYDNEGNLWICTILDGVYLVPTSNVSVWGRNGVACEWIQKLDNGKVIALSQDEITQYPEGKAILKAPPFPAKPWETPITGAIKISNGNWLIGTATDIIEWNMRDQREVYRYKVNSVKFIQFLASDSILVGSSHGVFVFDDQARAYFRKNIPYDEPEKHTRWIQKNRLFTRAYAASQSLHNLYVAGMDGLYHQIEPEGEFQRLKEAEDILISEISTGMESRTWFATRGNGVGCVDGDTVHFFTTKDGLSSNYCNAIETDSLGVWVATNKGLSRITLNKSDSRRHLCNIESVPVALPSQVVESIKLVGDTLWIATNRGLVSWKHRAKVDRLLPPSLYLRKLVVDGKERGTETSLRLKPRERNLAIEYQGVRYAPYSRVLYRYKILGVDEKWRNTEDTRLNFEKLPFGRHEIIVEAGVDGVQWSDPIQLPYVLERPFWQQFWFLVLLIVLLLAISWFTVSVRLRAVRKRERMRFRVLESEQKALRAQMNPHFIFNSLNSIQELIISEKLENAHFYLSRFGKLMRNILNNSENTFISLEEELEMLQLYLEMEQMRMAGKFEFEIKVDKEVDPGLIQFPTMISQIHAENSVWHGIRHLTKHGKITVSAKIKEKQFWLLIEDNGVGRDFTQRLNRDTGKRTGLRGCQLVEDRLKTINKALDTDIKQEIIDLKDDLGYSVGTRVVISFPYD